MIGWVNYGDKEEYLSLIFPYKMNLKYFVTLLNFPSENLSQIINNISNKFFF